MSPRQAAPRRGGAHCREEGRGRAPRRRAGRAMAQETTLQDSDGAAGAGDCCHPGDEVRPYLFGAMTKSIAE